MRLKDLLSMLYGRSSKFIVIDAIGFGFIQVLVITTISGLVLHNTLFQDALIVAVSLLML